MTIDANLLIGFQYGFFIGLCLGIIPGIACLIKMLKM